MKEFKDLVFLSHGIGNGVQARMDFNNDFGISVIKFKGSYGYPNLWEAAVFYKENITYNTDITNCVLGNQSDDDITLLMKQIQLLK